MAKKLSCTARRDPTPEAGGSVLLQLERFAPCEGKPAGFVRNLRGQLDPYCQQCLDELQFDLEHVFLEDGKAELKKLEAKAVADETFSALMGHPQVIRGLYQAMADPRPSCGWAGMLCEISRRAGEAAKFDPVQRERAVDIHIRMLGKGRHGC